MSQAPTNQPDEGHTRDHTSGAGGPFQRSERKRHRGSPQAEAVELIAIREKRRAHLTRRDSVLILVALLELCFLPWALKTLFVPVISHILRLHTPPIGLTFISMLAGTLLAILIFILLSFLLCKHAYTTVVAIMAAVLVLELVSYPLAARVNKLNDQQSQADAATAPVTARPAP